MKVVEYVAVLVEHSWVVFLVGREVHLQGEDSLADLIA